MAKAGRHKGLLSSQLKILPPKAAMVSRTLFLVLFIQCGDVIIQIVLEPVRTLPLRNFSSLESNVIYLIVDEMI